MINGKSFQKAFRLTLLTAIPLALFWFACSRFKPDAMIITESVLPAWFLFKPTFGEVSRWWDVLIAPIFSSLLVFLFSYWRKFNIKESLGGVLLQFQLTAFIVSLIIGLMASLTTFGIAYGSIVLLHAVLLFVLVFGFVSFTWKLPEIIDWTFLSKNMKSVS